MVYMSGSKLQRCERCGKLKRVLYDVEGARRCSDCIRGMAFYKVFLEGFRDPRLRGDVITVGMDVGNLTWFNPFAQAWYYPMLIWMYFRARGWKLTIEDLVAQWRYKTPLDHVLKVYVEEGVFRVIEEEGRHVIVEGDALSEVLKKYGDRPDVMDIVSSWVAGLIISRLHSESDAPDFRAVSAIIETIAGRYIDPDGNIKAEPYSKITGYRCDICGTLIPYKEDARRHVAVVHRVPTDEVMGYLREERTTMGYLVEISDLAEALERNGVRPERFLDRVEKFAVLVHEDPEEPRIVERDGVRYLVVDLAWFRVLARVRVYERELLRGRERA
jgi:uncharacterized C2H2 Zn-finger protein